MIEGEILSISDVIQCKISFEINGDDINYRIYSPIFESWREINGSFVNGMLDGRIKNIIIDKICDFVDVHDDVSRAAMLLSLGAVCEEVENHTGYFSDTQRGGKWSGYTVPAGYNIDCGCIRLEKKTQDDVYYIPFCRTPCMTVETGRNIDNDEYWVHLRFMNIYKQIHDEWISQQDALSRRGIMKLTDRGINLIEKNASTMNDYLSSCLMVNGQDMPRRFVTEKNGWKCDNTIFAFGKRGFSHGDVLNIVPLRKDAHSGLIVAGDIGVWIKAVESIIHLPMVRIKMYAVFAAPLLRLLNVQSFIIDHNGESSIGKTFTNDLAISMIGDADVLRFNGDTTKTAAEILAEMYTDLPLYLDETGTQQSEEVLKALIYMLANEQGRMRGHKDGGLRETGKWKTIALTTGEKPLTSHRSFSGQQVRVIEIRGGLSQEVIEDVKTMADIRTENYGHFVEPFFKKLDEYMPQLDIMFQMSRDRYITKDNVKTNRVASSFAVMLVAGMLLEDVFNDVGIEAVEPHTIIDYFFEKSIEDSVTDSYSVRALQTVVDWTKSKNMCFWDEDHPDENRSNEFYGWIDEKYIDIIPAELRKMLDRAGFDSIRTRNDWIDEGIVVVNNNRKDFKARHNGKDAKVIRFVRKEVNNVLFS